MSLPTFSMYLIAEVIDTLSQPSCRPLSALIIPQELHGSPVSLTFVSFLTSFLLHLRQLRPYTVAIYKRSRSPSQEVSNHQSALIMASAVTPQPVRTMTSAQISRTLLTLLEELNAIISRATPADVMAELAREEVVPWSSFLLLFTSD